MTTYAVKAHSNGSVVLVERTDGKVNAYIAAEIIEKYVSDLAALRGIPPKAMSGIISLREMITDAKLELLAAKQNGKV